MSEKLQKLYEDNNSVKTEIQQEEVESFWITRETALTRLKFIEKRNNSREYQISNIKDLLSNNPDKKEFFKLKWDYYLENPINAMRDVSDIILLQVVPRSKLEKIVSDFEKQEKESKNIEKLLKQNPNKNTFYELDGNYYTSNPSRVPWENISKILRVKEVSRIDLEAKIEKFEKWNIESISKKLDYLIDNWVSKNENIKKLLIELRIWISLNDNNSDISLLLWESLWNFIHLIEKSDTQALTIWEIINLISCSANIFRSWISDLVWVTISFLKDITSNHIYKFWKKDSFLEAKIRQSVEWTSLWGLEKYLFSDKTISWFKESSIEWLKWPLALTAWWIDWMLDYIQSSIDLVIMPDKIAQNIKDFIIIFWNNFSDTINELWSSFESESDYKYVSGYIIWIIVSFLALPSKYWILNLPKFIINWLKLSWKFSNTVITKVEWFLNSKITKIVDSISRKFPKTSETINKVWETSKQARDLSDNSNTLRKAIQRQSEELAKSRQALQIVNNSLKLANVFWDNITWVMSQKLSTDIAMTAYKEAVLKWNWFKSTDIDVLVRDTEWEVKYNLIRVKERLLEVEKIMKDEVLPIIKFYYSDISSFEKNKLLIDIKQNSKKYNDLSLKIFEKTFKLSL